MIPIDCAPGRVYVAFDEVNRVSEDHPFGRDLPSSYGNNRRDCSLFDVPADQGPLDPPDDRPDPIG